MNKSLVACILLLSGVAVLLLISLLRPDRNETCARLRARIDLSHQFCDGLADRAAKERCSELSSKPEVMGQCLRVVVPAAFSGCIDYLSLETMKREFSSVCE